MDDRFPTLKVDEIDACRLTALDGETFVVADGEINMACRLKLLPGADKLFIMLHGAVDRVKTPLPTFARWNYGKLLGGHVLAVCDPTLSLHDELRLGWFLGTAKIDPTKTLIDTANHFGNQLSINASNIIFYGSSGGGFTALIAASSQKIGRAICINPQVDVSRYYANPARLAAMVFDSGHTLSQIRATFPTRWSALEAIKVGAASGNDLRIFYAQNTVDDDFHFANHFTPFCDSLNAKIDGGFSANGKILTHLYSSSKGHGAEPPELVKVITSEGLNHLIPSKPQ